MSKAGFSQDREGTVAPTITPLLQMPPVDFACTLDSKFIFELWKSDSSEYPTTYT